MNDLSASFENQGCVISYSRNKGRMHAHLRQMYDFLHGIGSTYIFVNDIDKYADQFKHVNNTELSYKHMGTEYTKSQY